MDLDLKYVFSGPLQKSLLTSDLTFSKYWGQPLILGVWISRSASDVCHSPHFLVKKQSLTELWGRE